MNLNSCIVRQAIVYTKSSASRILLAKMRRLGSTGADTHDELLRTSSAENIVFVEGQRIGGIDVMYAVKLKTQKQESSKTGASTEMVWI